MSQTAEPGQPRMIQDLVDWLLDQALASTRLDELLDGCYWRLHAAGVPLTRAHVAFATLHPLYNGVSKTWTREQGLETVSHAHQQSAPERWLQSPLKFVIDHRLPHLRRRLTGPDAQLDFPFLEQLRARGQTDYLVYMIPFTPEVNEFQAAAGMVGSWATDRPQGFRDSDVRAFEQVQKCLAVALKVHIKDQIAHNVLATYLGPDAGTRVLDGQIKRGDGEVLHAVMWYSDLRGSTPLAEAMDTAEFLQALNRYFECSAGAVLERGGEVLRFIGDAVLAIFPVGADGDTAAACARAEAAARDARRALSRVNAERADSGDAPLEFGLGLHVGHVLFGNIGVPERLEFSVIGPTANEVARLEGLSKSSGYPVLASEDFVAHSSANWTPLPAQPLRGVGRKLAVFGLTIPGD